MPKSDGSKTQAERFLDYASASIDRKPMSVSSDDKNDADAEVLTPGQVVDAIFAQLVTQMQDLEQRLDILIGLAVRNQWIESEDDLEVKEHTSDAKATKRKTAGGDVGFVVPTENQDG